MPFNKTQQKHLDSLYAGVITGGKSVFTLAKSLEELSDDDFALFVQQTVSIDKGFRGNKILGKNHFTRLHDAAARANFPLLNLLMSQRLKPEVLAQCLSIGAGSENLTAMHYAVIAGFVPGFTLMLERTGIFAIKSLAKEAKKGNALSYIFLEDKAVDDFFAVFRAFYRLESDKPTLSTAALANLYRGTNHSAYLSAVVADAKRSGSKKDAAAPESEETTNPSFAELMLDDIKNAHDSVIKQFIMAQYEDSVIGDNVAYPHFDIQLTTGNSKTVDFFLSKLSDKQKHILYKRVTKNLERIDEGRKNPTIVLSGNNNVLHLAISSGKLSCVASLINCPIYHNPNNPNTSYALRHLFSQNRCIQSPLAHAIQKNYSEMVTYFDANNLLAPDKLEELAVSLCSINSIIPDIPFDYCASRTIGCENPNIDDEEALRILAGIVICAAIPILLPIGFILSDALMKDIPCATFGNYAKQAMMFAGAEINALLASKLTSSQQEQLFSKNHWRKLVEASVLDEDVRNQVANIYHDKVSIRSLARSSAMRSQWNAPALEMKALSASASTSSPPAGR